MGFQLSPELMASPDVQQILLTLDGLLKGTKKLVIDSKPLEDGTRHTIKVIDSEVQDASTN